jgi:hypothetical protein
MRAVRVPLRPHAVAPTGGRRGGGRASPDTAHCAALIAYVGWSQDPVMGGSEAAGITVKINVGNARRSVT